VAKIQEKGIPKMVWVENFGEKIGAGKFKLFNKKMTRV
jgi:hypothetical protein